MQILTPRATGTSGTRMAAVAAAMVGLALLAGGIALGWLAFGTPFMERFMVAGRPTTAQTLAGLAAWTFALTAPTGFLAIGLFRLYGVADALLETRERRPRTSRLARELGDDHVVAGPVRLPDGRPVPEVVIGPFGVAVIGQLPPSRATRQHDGRWEVRMRDGGWMPLENPLARAARDSERVRRWLGHEDRNFVVRTYAAVVSADPGLARMPNCAVITEAQVEPWLASLPPQRGLTASRRDSLVEMVREAI